MNDNDSNVLISVRELEKKFNGVTALKSVSTDIKKGEVVVMIGPSGSGKSTFLRCLNLLEIPTSGSILFNGVNITDKKVNINVQIPAARRHGLPAFQPFPSYDRA